MHNKQVPHGDGEMRCRYEVWCRDEVWCAYEVWCRGVVAPVVLGRAGLDQAQRL